MSEVGQWDDSRVSESQPTEGGTSLSPNFASMARAPLDDALNSQALPPSGAVPRGANTRALIHTARGRADRVPVRRGGHGILPGCGSLRLAGLHRRAAPLPRHSRRRGTHGGPRGGPTPPGVKDMPILAPPVKAASDGHAVYTELHRGESVQEKQVKEARSKCRSIAALLTDSPNPHSKGVLMFKKRRQRAKRYTLTCFGSVEGDGANEEDDDDDEEGVFPGSESELDEDGFTSAPESAWDSDYLDVLEKKTHTASFGETESPGLSATSGKGAQLFEQQRKRAGEHAGSSDGGGSSNGGSSDGRVSVRGGDARAGSDSHRAQYACRARYARHTHRTRSACRTRHNRELQHDEWGLYCCEPS
ncbi:hypothetical protein SKAU_G00142520 [Synaphobranchus kaupii]|uniref:Uncharacterized protein n=1 Tax=Synaphobranchus kaupii TaxID=118154 RepID=A0A9Q1J449_SYNKA|nr:hypothetical protein SKAU_G00142520 [Synaphobranchus kaupii]